MSCDKQYFRCDREPRYFMLQASRVGGVAIIWGLSAWEGEVDYRTLGIPYGDWLRRPENVGVRIESDGDRRFDWRLVRKMLAAAKRADGEAKP